MAQKTQSYRRTLSGSVGAGMKSVFGSGDRRFYTLVHKVSSRYHKAGEAQQIIVDQIELGRSPNCQVRFDESFSTVSRRHAAIVKDGDNWKLIQLSHTNSTYLNGHKIQNEWYLQNGDEIQLSTNGPKLGFIIPEGDKSKVKSLGLTARLNLFRQQALRPYKKALIVILCLLVLCVGFGVYEVCHLGNELNRYKKENIQLSEDFTKRIAETELGREKDRVLDSIRYANERDELEKKFQKEIAAERKKTEQLISAAQAEGAFGTGISALMESQNLLKDIYFLYTDKVVLVKNGTETVIYDSDGDEYGWSGTGFLLNDGRFVTARHCVEAWLYEAYDEDDPISDIIRSVATQNSRDYQIKAYLVAMSSISKTKFEFCSTDFVIDHSKDHREQIGVDDRGKPIYWTFTIPVLSEWNQTMYATDWAYTTKTDGKRGDIEADASLSKNLHPMQRLYVYGFPQGLGVLDGATEIIEPISNELTASREGLAANGCIMHSCGIDHGNSGGPLFALKDSQLVVVGIESKLDSNSHQYGWAVPICNIF